MSSQNSLGFFVNYSFERIFFYVQAFGIEPIANILVIYPNIVIQLFRFGSVYPTEAIVGKVKTTVGIGG